MSMFSDPDEHAANPPHTWEVVRAASRVWQLKTTAGGVIDTYTTKGAAESDRQAGRWVDLWATEARWYLGEHVHGWRPWADVLAGRQRNAAHWEARRAAG